LKSFLEEPSQNSGLRSDGLLIFNHTYLGIAVKEGLTPRLLGNLPTITAKPPIGLTGPVETRPTCRLCLRGSLDGKNFQLKRGPRALPPTDLQAFGHARHPLHIPNATTHHRPLAFPLKPSSCGPSMQVDEGPSRHRESSATEPGKLPPQPQSPASASPPSAARPRPPVHSPCAPPSIASRQFSHQC
jgi:hypothetical protein